MQQGILGIHKCPSRLGKQFEHPVYPRCVHLCKFIVAALLKLAVSNMAANCEESEEKELGDWRKSESSNKGPLECNHHPKRSRSIGLLADLPGYRPKKQHLQH